MIQLSYTRHECVFYSYKNCNYQLRNLSQAKKLLKIYDICHKNKIHKKDSSLFNDTIQILKKFSRIETNVLSSIKKSSFLFSRAYI